MSKPGAQLNFLILEDRLTPAAGVLREYWTGVAGSTVASLTALTTYPNAPSGADELTSFLAPANWGDNYGTRIRGYITPTISGDYELYLSADEQAELYVSNDRDPANALKVASISSPTAVQQWTLAAGQKAVVRLVAGQSYYIEALQKEAAGSDHLEVGWKVPGSSSIVIIPGTNLTPWRPTVRLYTDVSVTGENSGDPATFSVTRDGDLGRAITVYYTIGGTANAGSDYTALPGSVVIPAGQRSATIVVSTINDTAVEPSENITLTLAANDRYQLATPSSRTAFASIRDDDGLPASTVALANTTPAGFSFFGSGASRSTIAVTGQSFTQASRITTTTTPTNWYDIQLRSAGTAMATINDTLMLSFYARNAHPTKTSETFYAVLERNGSPYTKSLATNLTITGNGWHRFDLPFRALETYATTTPTAAAFFGLGYGDQVLEIGGISLVDYGSTVDPTALDVTNSTYQGRTGAESTWRDDANARIKANRTAPLTVQVRDSAGQPIDGAVVHLDETRNGFGFGSAVAASAINSTNPTNGPNYRNTITNYFNKAVLENDLKWYGWQSNPNTAIGAVNWLIANGVTDIRGHNLVWPSWWNTPASTGNTYGGINYRSDPNVEDSQEEYNAHVTIDGTAAAAAWLRQRVLSHIASEAGSTSLLGKLRDWDVVNEPYDNHSIQDVLVTQYGGTTTTYLKEWYDAARAADPHPRLFLNDYPSLGGEPHLDAFLSTISSVIAAGAPLDGIGIQGHFGATVPGMDVMLANLNRFNTFNKPLQITEFTVETTEEQFQADFTRDFMTLAFSQPNVDAFLTWGFWAGALYAPTAAMWRNDWTLKPNGQAWLDLTQAEWQTDVTGTSRGGTYSTQGYRGNYAVTVTFGGQTVSTTATLGGTGTVLTVVVPVTLPQVVAVSIGDGSSQRSVVRGATVTFNRAVTVDPGAFELTGPGGAMSVSATTSLVNNATVAVLTFSGAGTTAGSLDDGRYSLRVRADHVRVGSDPLMPMSADSVNNFHRFFGDIDGDADVDLTELSSFRAAFTHVAGDVEYNTAFDADSDGDVDITDLASFRQRFGTALP